MKCAHNLHHVNGLMCAAQWRVRTFECMWFLLFWFWFWMANWIGSRIPSFHLIRNSIPLEKYVELLLLLWIFIRLFVWLRVWTNTRIPEHSPPRSNRTRKEAIIIIFSIWRGWKNLLQSRYFYLKHSARSLGRLLMARWAVSAWNWHWCRRSLNK